MLVVHYEGAHASVRGVFAIYARPKGLGSDIAFDSAADLEGRNELDRLIAATVATEISKATGLPVRAGLHEGPGAMGELQTGVALSYGTRFAMIAGTPPR